MWTTVCLLALTWLGVNASWGLTDPGDTLVSAALAVVAPLEKWLLATLTIAGGAAVAARWRGRPAVGSVAAMLFAYLAGTWLAGSIDSRSTVGGSLGMRRFVERSVQLLSPATAALAPLGRIQ